MEINYYWELTPRQYTRYIKAYKKKVVEDIKRLDMLNFALAKYIAIAVNNPKKYPQKPFSYIEKQRKNSNFLEVIKRLNKLNNGEVKNADYN